MKLEGPRIIANLTLKAGETLLRQPVDAKMAPIGGSVRGSGLLQVQSAVFDNSTAAVGIQDPCRIESVHALILLVCLCSTIVMIICAFIFFREDKEEQITPLCPQLVVKDAEQSFKMPLDSQADAMTVTDLSDQTLCKVILDWPDPFRPGASGVAATVRLQNSLDQTLATVVARNVAVVGQGLALCRSGCEIFGFVEPEGPRRYHVRHRTGVHLLTLEGDFGGLDIEGINPVGSKVCWFKKQGSECRGRVLQHVDAGLVMCSLLATHVHRRLTMSAPPSLPPTFTGGARGAPATASGSKAEHTSVVQQDQSERSSAVAHGLSPETGSETKEAPGRLDEAHAAAPEQAAEPPAEVPEDVTK